MRAQGVVLGLVLGLVCAGSVRAQDVSYRFEWDGGGEYVMQGALSFDPALLGKNPIIETDLTCFEIKGLDNGVEVGRWALQMLLPDTTWRLTLDVETSEFVVFGEDAAMPQAWNMDGFGTNCGNPGFGFNIGNAAQDLCVDGALIVESQVAPARPFAVTRVGSVKFSPDACNPELLLGALSLE